jgi:uncharacterized protein YjbI with pentapeptide repeats
MIINATSTAQTSQIRQKVTFGAGNGSDWFNWFQPVADSAKSYAPLAALYGFFKREEFIHGAQRFVGREEFNRRTNEMLADDSTPDSRKVHLLQIRDRWGLPLFVKPQDSIVEEESKQRRENREGYPIPFITYQPTKDAPIKGKNLQRLQIPSRFALPYFWRPWFNPGIGVAQLRPGANMAGTKNSPLNYDRTDLSRSTLPGLNASNTTLRHVNATDANWIGGRFINTLFLKTGLIRTKLAGSRFINVTGLPSSDPQFWHPDLSRIWLHGKNAKNKMAMTFQDFKEKVLEYAEVQHVDLLGSIFKRGSLMGAHLGQGVRIIGANFKQTNLQRLFAPKKDWAKANVFKSNMSGVQTPGSDFKAIQHLETAQLASTPEHPGNYSHSDLRGQNLSNKDISHNNFNHTLFSPHGEPKLKGPRPYKIKRWAVSRYLVPFTLRANERRKPDDELANTLKDPTSRTGQKLRDLAFMDKPQETRKLEEADTDEARLALVRLAREKNQNYRVVAASKIRDQHKILNEAEYLKVLRANQPADLSGAKADYSNFSFANLRGTNLKGTRFKFSDLHMSRLADADVEDARLKTAKRIPILELIKARNADKLVFSQTELDKLEQSLASNTSRTIKPSDLQLIFSNKYLSRQDRIRYMAMRLIPNPYLYLNTPKLWFPKPLPNHNPFQFKRPLPLLPQSKTP